jgi:PAS domain S-box-containing protein
MIDRDRTPESSSAERRDPLPTYFARLRHPSRWFAYPLAIVLTLATLVVRLAIGGPSDKPLLELFLAPMLIRAYVGGLGPGLLATALSTLVIPFFLLPPTFSFQIANLFDVAEWNVIILAGMLISTLIEALHRSRRHAETSRHLQTITLASIGDGVMSADAQGRITFLNPEAERLTGWRSTEAIGKPLSAVFQVADAQTRAPIGDRSDMMQHHNAVSDVSFHAVLLGLNGRETPIDYRSAPIQQADGTLAGEVLVFRDIAAAMQAEAALNESQERLAGIVGSAMDAIISVDATLQIVVFNAAAEQIFGCPAEAAIGQPLDRFIPQPFRDLHAAHIRAFGQTGITSRSMSSPGSLTALRADGTEFPIEATISQTSVGGKSLYTVILRDITRRTQAEAAVRESEQRYRQIVETAQEGIWQIDASNRTTFVNTRMAAILGSTVDEMIGASLFDFMDAEGQAITAAAIDRRRQGIAEQYEFKYRRKDGGDVWALLSTNPVLDRAGNYAGALAMVTDITARKRDEQALRQSESRFATAFRASPVCMSITSLKDGRYIDINASHERLFGYTRDELIGQSAVGISIYADPNQRSEVVRAISTYGSLHETELTLRTKSGELREVLCSLEAIEVNGEACILGSVFDITERKQAEEDLRESEERLRAVTDTAQIGLVIVDADHRYRYANPAYAAIFHLPSAEIIGQNVADVLVGVYADQIRPRLELAFSSERVNYELIVPPRTEEQAARHYDVTYEPGVYRGSPVVVVVVVDITERKTAELALRASEERFSRIFQLSPTAKVITRMRDGIVLDANEALLELFGFARDEVIGHATDGLWFYDDEAERDAIRQELIAHRRVRNYETRLTMASGRKLNVLFSVELIELDGEACALSIALDITERKRAEAEAARSTERVRILATASRLFAEGLTSDQALFERIARTIAEALHDYCGIRMLSADGQWLNTVALYNASAEPLDALQITMAAAPVPIGALPWLQQALQGDRALRMPTLDPAQIQSTLHERDDRPDMTQINDYDRVVVDLRVGGQPIGVIGVTHKRSSALPYDEDDLRLVQDLADRAALAISNSRLFAQVQAELVMRQRAQAELEDERALLARRVEERTADLILLNAELARAARLKDEFLANMSHELRTPLNSILGRSEALQEEIYGPLTAKQADTLRGVEASGRHLLALINDILDLSKIEAGKLDLEIESVDVRLLCHTCVQMVAQTALQKRITISSTIDTQVEVILADERRLKQLLVNLLSNAVKFTPSGGQVGLELHCDERLHTATFTIWDTGIGIAEEDLQRLFKPFVQIDSRLSRQYEGTGLGLALVLRLAEAHGGSVSVASQPGQGSRFSVTLPWEPVQPSHTPISEDAAGTSMPPIRQVLVIEDSPTAAQQIARYLAELGAHVEVHRQGGGAIEHAIALLPDLIVLDILLPDQSGWDVLRQLKAEPRTHAIQVVVVSVLDELKHATALGAAALLVKPINRLVLIQTLQTVMRPASEQPAVGASQSRPIRILLAEDNQSNIDVLQGYLQVKGYEVVLAQNGSEALLRIQAARPDIILMDIQMPGMDGLEAIRHIRADVSLRDIPIIALTALAMPGDRERCLRAGADDYLTKPVNLRMLLATIDAQLQQHQEPAPERRPENPHGDR